MSQLSNKKTQEAGAVSPWLSALGFALYFAALGPLFGAVFLIGIVLPVDYTWRREELDTIGLARGILWALPMALMSYPVALFAGAVPAAITGVIYFILRTRTFGARRGSGARVLIMSIAGGLSCASLGFLYGELSGLLSWEFATTFALPGMAASAMCTWIVERRRRL